MLLIAHSQYGTHIKKDKKDKERRRKYDTKRKQDKERLKKHNTVQI